MTTEIQCAECSGTGEVECSICRGSGDCPDCGGRGFHEAPKGTYFNCIGCDDGNCAHCIRGMDECDACDGGGYLERPDQVAPADIWERECRLAMDAVLKEHRFEMQADIAEEAALRLLGIARHLAGKACTACGGQGQRAYADTSTWRRGGMAGQMMTVGTCDECWGTGRNDRKGPDLRRIQRADPGDPHG